MARVDYNRMTPDHLEGRALPAGGMEPWRDQLAADAETTPAPVVDRLDLLVLRKPAQARERA